MISLKTLLHTWRRRAAARKEGGSAPAKSGPFAASLQLRHLDGGSCNACEMELVALSGPHYDSARLGIDFVASPRHADGLVLTGPITRNLATAVFQTVAAAPRPRLVIACGDCACGQGPFAGAYAVLDSPGSLVNIDVAVPGCPPRPADLLAALSQAQNLKP